MLKPVTMVTNFQSRLRFDVVRDVTALQLRQLGFYIGEMIPDQAFVRRTAVGLDSDEILDDGTATLRLDLLEPFMATA